MARWLGTRPSIFGLPALHSPCVFFALPPVGNSTSTVGVLMTYNVMLMAYNLFLIGYNPFTIYYPIPFTIP